MSQNKIVKEFLENTYDKEENYYAICSKIKGGINRKKKIANIAAIFVMIVIMGTVVQKIYARIAWNIDYKEYQNRKVITKNLAIEEVKEGYSENFQMNYIVQDEIGIKIKSLMMTNDYVGIDLDMQLPETPEKISYGYVVYDENNNIYAFSERPTALSMSNNYWKKLKQELGIKWNQNSILSDSASWGSTKIQMNSSIGFPHSRKLYVRIFDIGYETYGTNGRIENICLSDGEWQFTLEVPEKFYERTTTELMLSQEIEGIVLNKAELTETGLSIRANIKELRNFLMTGKEMEGEDFDKMRNAAFYLSDEEGNLYIPISMGTTKNDDEIQAKFEIGKQDFNKKIYLNVSLNDVQARVELIEK